MYVFGVLATAYLLLAPEIPPPALNPTTDLVLHPIIFSHCNARAQIDFVYQFSFVAHLLVITSVVYYMKETCMQFLGLSGSL